MTATEARTEYTSGWCATGSHDRCRGGYAGVPCHCVCQHLPPDPEPVALHHCPTCTCRGLP